MDNFSEKEIVRIRKLVGENAQVVGVLIAPATRFDLLTNPDRSCVRGGGQHGVNSDPCRPLRKLLTRYARAAKLMKEAIGDRFHAILVDTGKIKHMPIYWWRSNHPLGLMRLNECEQVKETLDKHLGINLTVVDGSELFLSRLAGVTEPEAKRKIIGGTCEFPLTKNRKQKLASLVLTQTVIDLFEIEALR